MLSVIISVYNVGPYIEECVKSVCELSIPCEIIIVHDAQKDTSFKGDEDFLKDERITILDRPNAGLGIARNQGLEVAKGEYVHFLDGDDRIIAERMVKLYQKGKELGADVICGDYDDTDTPKKCQGPKKMVVVSGPDFLSRYCDTMNTCVWRYIFKRCFLLENKLLFDGVKYFEDLAFLPRAIYDAKLVYFDNIPFYYYRYTENTLSNVFNKKRTLDIFTCFNILNKKSKEMRPDARQVLGNKINDLVFDTIYYSRKSSGFDEEVSRMSRMCVESMQANNIRTRINLLANKLSWNLCLKLNDTYCATRLYLGKTKQKMIKK